MCDIWFSTHFFSLITLRVSVTFITSGSRLFEGQIDTVPPKNLKKFMLMFSRSLSPMVSMRKSFDGKMQKNPSEIHGKIMHGFWRANGLGAG